MQRTLSDRIALALLLIAAALDAQDAGKDAHTADKTRTGSIELGVSVSPAQLAFVQAPEVILIDDQRQLDAFQKRARVVPEGHPLRKYHEQLEPMRVDFGAVRLVAICWGPHPFERQARLHVERARMIGETVQLEVRSSMVIGPVPARAGNASTPKTVFPANIIAIPRTQRAIVNLGGARLADGGFSSSRSKRLTVNVAPDSMPLRERVVPLPMQQFYVQDEAPPHVLVQGADKADRQILDIAWCQFTSEINHLQVEQLELRGDALHVGVVARRTRPMVFSGPPTMRPRLRFEAPASARVVVHIRRLGDAIRKDEALVDFEPFQRTGLEVTVEHQLTRKPDWQTRGFRRD